jgi:hypothetical protein
MKLSAIAMACVLTTATAAAFAQDNTNRNYPYDPDTVAREQAREVWRDNYGPDAYRGRDDRWRDDRYRDNRDRRGMREECWNPRARHFEGVREGERQDDLDFSRCRVVSERNGDRYGWR